MPRSQKDPASNTTDGRNLRVYFTREPVVLALLFVAAAISFAAVSWLSHLYHTQQKSLGNRWFVRGIADLKEKRFERAGDEFRTALLYSRDNYTYRLDLAEALIGLKRTDEAHSYLINLWEREPENGLVNLELARIGAQKGETDEALRYYNGAIYAVWPDNQEVESRSARFELIEFLLRINAKQQAQSELIALAANLGGDASQHVRVGDLFLQAQDFENALAEYRLSLKSDHHNMAALKGAGRAAYQLGRYALVQSYLQAAVARNPHDAQSAALLHMSQLVLEMDPFRQRILADQRSRIVVDAFGVAGVRLKSCQAVRDAKSTGPSVNALENLLDDWIRMNPKITGAHLRRDPGQIDTAMNLVFEIERQTNIACGPPSGKDMALSLIAQLHEGY